MGLRTTAENDLAFILENKACGFGFDITVTNPSLTVAQFVGFSNDISQVIDPDTGQVVSGRSASVALRMTSLNTAFSNVLPVGIADASSKPWIVEFLDIAGFAHKFKVIKSNPDRALGIVTLLLDRYVWLQHL